VLVVGSDANLKVVRYPLPALIDRAQMSLLRCSCAPSTRIRFSGCFAASLRREGVVVQRFVLPRVSESIVRSVTALQGYNNHISPFFNRMLRASSSLGMKNIYLEVLERIVGASLYVVLLTFDDRPHK